MKIVASPIADLSKWIRGPTLYQHIRLVDDQVVSLMERQKDKYFWIADIDTYTLRGEMFSGSNKIACYSYRFFGRPSVMQSWGFDSDIKDKKGQRVARFGNDWYLVDSADEFLLECDDQPPYEAVILSINSRQGHKSVTIRKK